MHAVTDAQLEAMIASIKDDVTTRTPPLSKLAKLAVARSVKTRAEQSKIAGRGAVARGFSDRAAQVNSEISSRTPKLTARARRMGFVDAPATRDTAVAGSEAGASFSAAEPARPFGSSRRLFKANAQKARTGAAAAQKDEPGDALDVFGGPQETPAGPNASGLEGAAAVNWSIQSVGEGLAGRITPALRAAAQSRNTPFAIAAFAGASALALVAALSVIGGMRVLPVDTSSGPAPESAPRSGDLLLSETELAEHGLAERADQAATAVGLAAMIDGYPGQLADLRLHRGASPEARELTAEVWFASEAGSCAQRTATFQVDPTALGVGAVTVRDLQPPRSVDCPNLVAQATPYAPDQVEIEVASGPLNDPFITGDVPSLPAGASVARPTGGFLDADTLGALLSARPVKCVDPARPGFGDGPRLPGGCAERTEYDLSLERFTTTAPMDGGLRLEISGGLSVDGDQICHLTRGLAALVIGDGMSDDAALRYERAVEARYARVPGGRICHRYRSIGGDNSVFAAETFVLGLPSTDRRDARAFEMRPRG